MQPREPKVRPPWRMAAVLLGLQAFLLAWGALRHSPGWDEPGHLVAGLSHWRYGRFELYRVNPPLVRLAAAVPVMIAGYEMPEDGFFYYPHGRAEHTVGETFLRSNGARSFFLFTLARWGCIPIVLLGGYVVFRWAYDLYGAGASLVALALWCFCPNVLGNGQLLTPDAGAAALGVVAAYLFWRWLNASGWRSAYSAGIALGLAELTKTTWIVLFLLWPLLWLLRRLAARKLPAARPWIGEAGQLGLILLVGLFVLNLGYGLEGSGTKLGDFSFMSEALGGPKSARQGDALGNRFAATWLGRLPVPLPKNYVLGIDTQRGDFENKMWSYLRGQWQLGGWWYYYLYGLAIKVPLGAWGLMVLALLAAVVRRGYAASWMDEAMLLAPLAAVLALVSSQTGFNHHLRYVLSVLPFAYIVASKTAKAFLLGHRGPALLATALLVWSVGSSLWIYPHSLSYYNEAAGGPAAGHYHLGNSNMDWGQDLLFLKRWLDRHPEVKPLRLAYDLPLVDPALVGIEHAGTPPTQGPEPGWYVVSVNLIHRLGGEYEYFLQFEPVARVGYSMHVYHITPEEAARSGGYQAK